MEISKYDLEQREKYIAEAKAAPFLDAVFLIIYFNREFRRWGPGPKPEAITPQEVFADFDVSEYDDAARRSWDLLTGSSVVGMAFFKYPSVALSYEDALKKFYNDNPGFGGRSYALAIHVGTQAMR